MTLLNTQFEWKAVFFYNLGFTPCKAEQPLQGMELQENEAQEGLSITEIYLERSYS